MVLTHLNSFHNRAVIKSTKLGELSLDNIFSKLILPLQIAILETELNILLTKHSRFKPLIGSIDLPSKSLVEKWLLTVDFLFKDAYSINKSQEITEFTLGDTNFHRYKCIVALIRDDLGPFIEVRNRLSHGQWEVAFNYDVLTKNQALTTSRWTISKKDIMLLRSFVKNLPILIELLLIGKKVFESGYDRFLGRIQRAKKDADLKYLTFVNKGKRATS